MARRAGTGGGPAPRQTAVHPDASAWPPDARACSGYQRASTLPGSRARSPEFQTKHSRAPTPCQERKRVPVGRAGASLRVSKEAFLPKAKQPPAAGLGMVGCRPPGHRGHRTGSTGLEEGARAALGGPFCIRQKCSCQTGLGGGIGQTRTCPHGTHRPLRVSLWPARGLKPEARSRAAEKAGVGLRMRI